MTASQIVTIIRTLIEADQTDDQIANTLDTMGAFDAATGAEINEAIDQINDEAEAPAPVTARRQNGGIAPSVKYVLLPKYTTAQRLAANISDGTRPFEVASYILRHGKNGLTKRQIQAGLNITKGAAMSAIHNLQTRNIVKSVPLAPAPKARRAPAPQAVRRALR